MGRGMRAGPAADQPVTWCDAAGRIVAATAISRSTLFSSRTALEATWADTHTKVWVSANQRSSTSNLGWMELCGGPLVNSITSGFDRRLRRHPSDVAP
jgi:hypothetical protein